MPRMILTFTPFDISTVISSEFSDALIIFPTIPPAVTIESSLFKF